MIVYIATVLSLHATTIACHSISYRRQFENKCPSSYVYVVHLPTVVELYHSTKWHDVFQMSA